MNVRRSILVEDGAPAADQAFTASRPNRLSGSARNRCADALRNSVRLQVALPFFQSIYMRAIMKRFQASTEDGRAPFAEIAADDGHALQLSPRRRARRRRGRGPDLQARAIDRKSCQLCRQVALVLDEALADCADDVLQNLRVLSVVPCPNSSRLLVTVMSIDDRPGDTFARNTVLDHLKNATGHLRDEVASAVTRRRAPVLVYQVRNSGSSSLQDAGIPGPICG